MIQVYKLTKRHMDDNEKLPRELKEIKIFSTCVGHAVGTIDFSEKILELQGFLAFLLSRVPRCAVCQCAYTQLRATSANPGLQRRWQGSHRESAPR